MANNMENRLQFVHCNTIFDTRENAIAYVAGEMEEIQRPALYAEPMILRYGDKENPNIILAIGSKGDGKTPSKSNKTFFIDFSQLKEEIDEIKDLENGQSVDITKLQDLVNAIIPACGLDKDGIYVPFDKDPILSKVKALRDADLYLSLALQEEIARAKEAEENLESKLTLTSEETNSIKIDLNKEGEGVVIKGDVKLQEYKTVGQSNLPNQILIEENGIYHYVDLKYDSEDSVLTFSVNGEEKKLNLPKETYVKEGEYDYKQEALVLTLNRKLNPQKEDSDKIVIDLGKLIGEWTVLGEHAESPVILTKEHVKANEVLHGVENYQDILKADIRIPSVEYKPFNILEKTEDNKYLFVDGRADNIKYLKNGQIISVKQALDEIDCHVSNHDGNIIFKKDDGIFADVKLDYITATNTLRFTKTTKEGTTVSTEHKLNNISFLETIFYDSLKEEIVILYKNANGEVQELRIPVRGIIEEWEVDNTNHTVTLIKSDHQIAGKDKLSADVNIASTPDNILKVVNHGLHVKGTSDNIKHNETTVKNVLDLLNAADDTEGSIRNLIKKETDERKASDEALQGLISKETERAEAAEKVLDDKILENTTNIQSNKNAIDGEIARATAEEKRVESKFDTALEKQSTVNTQITKAITTLNDELDVEVTRATAAEQANAKAIADEIKRSSEKDKEIETAFNAYKENSDRQHDEFNKSITKLSEDLATEKETRANNDKAIGDALSDEVARSREAEAQLDSKITGVDERVKANTNSINTINTNITSLTTKLDDEITRAKNAEQVNAQAIAKEVGDRTTEITRVDGLIAENNRLVTSESNRAKAVEELLRKDVDANKKAIQDEVTRATAAEQANAKAIANLEKKTTMTANNTGTINLTKTVLESGEGYTLSGVVNVATTKGNILNGNGSALYANVDLVYDGDKNTLTLKTSNNDDKVIALNAGSIIESIRYESATTELVITYKSANGETHEVRVNVGDLFNEWTVENVAEHAVTLVKEDKLDGTSVLKADVKVSSEENNLLVKSTGNLYVSNQAKGIKFEDGKSVVDVTNEMKQTIASNKQTLDDKDNELEGKITEAKNLADSNKTEIDLLKAKDTTLEGNISDLNSKISEEITNRTSADSALSNEIDKNKSAIEREIVDRTASDTALGERITVLETNLPQEVQDRIASDTALGERITTVDSKITKEISDREKADIALSTRIDGVQRLVKSEEQRAMREEAALSDKIGNNKEDITNIKNTLTTQGEKINSHDTSINTLKEQVSGHTTQLTTLDGKVEQYKKDSTYNVINTESVKLIKTANEEGGYSLSGEVLVSSADGNIINKTGALFASVDIEYNSAQNALTLKTSNGGNKTVKLNVGSIIKSITYDSLKKELVITYIDENQQEKETRVPVADLYNEWKVEDRDESAIKLTKTKGEDGIDVLGAEVKIATPSSGNLLQNTNGNLYVSNKALDIKLSDHVGTNVETAIVNLNNRLTEAEGDVADNTELVNSLKEKVDEHTTLIKNNSDKIEQLIIDNNQNELEITNIKKQIISIEENIDTVEGRLDVVEGRLDVVESKISDLQNKTNIETKPSQTVKLTFEHTSKSSSLQADVKVSKEANNLITVKEDGLHVLEDYDFGTY